MTRLSFALALLLLAMPAAAAPDFVPNPKQSFEGFVAINAPRADVPVGALWVEGYGPVGVAASPDNIETVRSLNGLTIDRNLQISLTVGLFELFGIEPRLRDRFMARFGELSIVRVKDVSKLAGPPGEPRIVEALKAATIIVTSDGEAGINARAGWRLDGMEGSGTSGRTRAHSIEGRDMFIAVRVAAHQLTASEEREVRLSDEGGALRGRVDDFEAVISGGTCPAEAGTDCAQRQVGIIRITTHPRGEPAERSGFDADGAALLKLPVPIADDRGGLYERIRLRWVEACAVRRAERCGRRPRLFARFEGSRIADLKSPDGVRW